MLQEISTRLIIPEPSEDLIVNEPWSIEFYADGLMDELFADIDDILDVSGHLPSQTLRNGSRTSRNSTEETIAARDWLYQSGNSRSLEYDAVQTLNIPQIVLPNTLNRTTQNVPQVRNKQVNAVVVDAGGVKSITKRYDKVSFALRKLLISGATIGIAIAGIIYVINSGVLTVLTSKLTQQSIYLPESQSSPKVDVEAELVDYMLGALAIIDQKDATNNQPLRSRLNNRIISNPTSVALNNNQPPIGNLPPIPTNPPNVVERIYVPIYQAPLPMRYAPPRIPGVPAPLPPVANNSTSQSNVVKTALNAVQTASKPVNVNLLSAAISSQIKPVAVRTAPVTVQQQPSPLPSLPVVPFGTASPQVPNAGEAVSLSSLSTTSVAPAPTHTLEGLLELGNKSVALFQFGGVSRRINIGESIGSSGWTLVDVSNGEAIVRRNGEVRSIYAGQKL